MPASPSANQTVKPISVLRIEKDPESKDRLSRTEKELADLKEDRSRFSARWEREKATIQQLRSLKADLESLRLEVEQAQRAGHIPTAASVPWSKAANDDGTFKSDDELREIYTEAGVAEDFRIRNGGNAFVIPTMG